MNLITKAQHEQLRSNSKRQAEDENETFDPKPVVKLFYPLSAATWLLTEIDEDGRPGVRPVRPRLGIP